MYNPKTGANMRYVLFVTLPATMIDCPGLTVHMQYVDSLEDLQNIIEDMSEEDDRYQFEILPCKE